MDILKAKTKMKICTRFTKTYKQTADDYEF